MNERCVDEGFLVGIFLLKLSKGFGDCLLHKVSKEVGIIIIDEPVFEHSPNFVQP